MSSGAHSPRPFNRKKNHAGEGHRKVGVSSSSLHGWYLKPPLGISTTSPFPTASWAHTPRFATTANVHMVKNSLGTNMRGFGPLLIKTCTVGDLLCSLCPFPSFCFIRCSLRGMLVSHHDSGFVMVKVYLVVLLYVLKLSGRLGSCYFFPMKSAYHLTLWNIPLWAFQTSPLPILFVWHQYC